MAEQSSTTRLPVNWISTFATLIAPTTLVGALLLYFGFAYTDALYEYFGIDAATLGFSTQDYLLRSAGALYLPMGAALLLGLLAVLAYYLASAVGSREQERAIVVRYASYGLMLCGAVLFLLGMLGGFQIWPAAALATPLLLGGGLLLIVCGRVCVFKSRGTDYPLRKEWGALVIVAALIVLSSFWATNVYAQQHGRADARYLAQNLRLRPAVMVDTAERLYFEDPGVRETPLVVENAGQRFRYRYEGLRLLAQSSNRMFIIPDSWTASRGHVLIAPVDSDIRVSFHPE